MRTALDNDSDVLEAARALAVARTGGMGKIVSELARSGLQKPAAKLKPRRGMPVFRRRAGTVVTNEMINRLREDEGV